MSMSLSLRAFAPLFWCGCGLLLAGCGGASISGLVPVTGKVTLDGQPLSGAQVVFVPSGGTGRAASAATDASGVYSLVTNTDKGAMPGNYKVQVNYITRPDGTPITTFEEGMDITQLEASGQAKQILPPRYSDHQQSELSFEVKSSGKNEYNIDMKKG
jgi:hypothetical protein